jgi:hypothetical protein
MGRRACVVLCKLFVKCGVLDEPKGLGFGLLVHRKLFLRSVKRALR